MLAEAPAPLVNQSRDDVQLVRATLDPGVTIDPTRCRLGEAQTVDCTDELSRVAGAPSLERITVHAGSSHVGCQLLRVTTATKTAALPAALGIGFYAADTAPSQFSNNVGRLVPTTALKTTGNAQLKSGQPAVLHEFAALVNCQVAPGTIAGKQLKPYMDFVGGPPRTVFRNWDPFGGNYVFGTPAEPLDRGPAVLR
jgi:hypothetical protein